MTTSGRAIGEMLVRRHRRGLIAVVGWMAFLAAATAVAPVASSDVAGLVGVLFGIGACYIAAVFAFGFDTDVAGAGTCYPARMFTLPVRTAELALWPVLFGAAALALLWLGTAGLLFRPWGFKVPLAWPALLAAAQLAWMQALLWWPFGLPWARVVVAILIGHVPVSGLLYLRQTGADPGDVTAFLGITFAVGVAGAYAAVFQARRGAAPRWGWLPSVGRVSAALRGRTRAAFGSAHQAQAWHEWRRHGYVLPLLVAALLPAFLLPLFVDDHSPGLLLRNFALVLGVPVFFAGMAGTIVGKHNPWSRDYYGVPSFTATRPVTTAELVASMLRAAARTTLIAWAVAAGMIAAAVLLSGAHEELGNLFRRWLDVRPAAEVVATLIVVIALLLLLTWKRLTENLLIGLTGREWFIKGSVFVSLFVFFNLVVFGLWLLIHPEHHARAREILPWAMAAAVAAKFAAGAAAVRGLRRKRLVAGRTLAALAAGWAVVYASLFGLLAWVVPAEAVPTHNLALAVALVMPLARVTAMPLALDWNRHR